MSSGSGSGAVDKEKTMLPRKLKTLFVAGSVAGLVFMSGCGEEITTTTRLLPGGGIEREISLENAKSGGPSDWGPIPRDDTWAASTAPAPKRDADKGEPLYIHMLTRRFPSARDMRAALAGYPADGSMLVPEITWTKKWRGFYKVYAFRESYPVLAIFRHSPAGEFFSPEELTLLRNAIKDEKSAGRGRSEKEMDALRQKFTRWTGWCVAEDLLRALIREADDRGDAQGSRWLRDNRDSVREAMIKAQDVPEHNPELGPGPFVAKLDEILRTDYFGGLLEKKSPGLASWEKRRRFVDAHILDSFPFRLVMPGLMTSTNSRDIKGNVASWKLDAIDLAFADFEMTAESRAVNWTAVGLAGLGLLALLALAVRGAWSLRGRSRPIQ
jgi:hypothetical protein